MPQEFSTLPELLAFTIANAHSNAKAYCRLGALPEPVARAVARLVASKPLVVNLLVDSDAIRHTFAQHGLAKSQAEALRGQIPIQENDILGLATWLPAVGAVAAGQAKPGKPPRVELMQVAAAGTTVAILEWRAGRGQLALVTMYKKRPTT